MHGCDLNEWQPDPPPDLWFEVIHETLRIRDLQAHIDVTDVDYEAIGVAPLFLEAFTSGTVTMQDILTHCRNYRRGLEAAYVTPMHAHRMVTRGNSQTSDRPP
jgi:hypothetical protein